MLAAAEDVAAEHGARSPAAWLAHRTRADHAPAARQGRLAEALDARWHQLGEALVEGRASVAQAETITRALDALPDTVAPEVLVKAEAHLVAAAAAHTPTQLRVLGRKVLEVVAPEVYEDHERVLLEAEEARAARRTSLTMRVNGDGTTDIALRLPDAAAERLRVYLEAYTSPRQHGRDPTRSGPVPALGAAVERRPYPVRLGQAFCALLEHLPATVLPIHGGTATTMIVTIDWPSSSHGTGVAQLATGGQISAGQARRLACTAGIIPLVLGGKSQPLDLGRTRRLFSPDQRKALVVRDRQCRVEGCTIPAAWCEAHHYTTPWTRGGRTDLADGILLCSHHHHRIHQTRYHHQLLPNGDIQLHLRR